jgi:hypothetical protein
VPYGGYLSNKLVLNTMAAYMRDIGIADERWNASVARNRRSCFFAFDHGCTGTGEISGYEEGRCGFAPAFFIAGAFDVSEQVPERHIADEGERDHRYRLYQELHISELPEALPDGQPPIISGHGHRVSIGLECLGTARYRRDIVQRNDG